jgi:hypothetical protein
MYLQLLGELLAELDCLCLHMGIELVMTAVEQQVVVAPHDAN